MIFNLPKYKEVINRADFKVNPFELSVSDLGIFKRKKPRKPKSDFRGFHGGNEA